MKLFAVSTVILVTLLPIYLQGAEPAPDPFTGKWWMDVKASRYPGKTCPKAMTIEMKRERNGIHYHSHTEPLVGEPFEVDYTADYDGKPALVTGTRGILLPVTLQRTQEGVTAIYRNAFQVAATSRRVLSDHDRTMTITTLSYDAAGSAVTNIGVYRRAFE